MFNLKRYFTILCLVTLVVGAVFLGTSYRILALSNLTKMGENNAISLNRSFSRYVWPQYTDLISQSNPHQVNISSIAPAFDDSIRQLIGGSPITKIEIYNIQGIQIYSTNGNKSDELKHDKSLVLAAINNETTSKLIHRDTFNSITGNIHNVELLATFLPIQRTPDSPVEAVIEIYSDVTAYYNNIKDTEIKVFLLGFIVLSAIFSVLFLFIKRADKVIKSHDLNLNQHIEKVNNINRTLKHSAQELAIAKDNARDSSMLKSNFVANMSHELRTPLNAIIGYSELMMEECKDLSAEDIKSDSEKINSASKHLLGLINDILDISKIEAGKMEFCIENFNISLVINDISATIEPLVKKNNNKLIVNCDSDIGITVADLSRTRQSIYNLLSNACKYTNDGVITLSVTREKTAHKEWILYSITDTGIGIAPEHIKAIFKDVSATDSMASRSISSSGLGLAISRRFCEMMGGSISVSSNLGVGSTFIIRLPAIVGQSQLAEYEESQPDPEEMRLRDTQETDRRQHISKILIIDDDKSIQALMAYILRTEGYQAINAMSGKAGLNILETETPDAIVLDIMMPEMDGWAVLKQLKDTPALKYTPIVMLSALGEISMGETLGADGYITKPFNRKQVIDTLSNAIRTKKAINKINDTILENR